MSLVPFDWNHSKRLCQEKEECVGFFFFLLPSILWIALVLKYKYGCSEDLVPS